MPPFARYVGPMEPIPPHLHMEIMALLLRVERKDHKFPAAVEQFLERLRSQVDEQSALGKFREIARQHYPNVSIDSDAIVSSAAEKGKRHGVWVQGWVYIEQPAPRTPARRRTT